VPVPAKRPTTTVTSSYLVNNQYDDVAVIVVVCENVTCRWNMTGFLFCCSVHLTFCLSVHPTIHPSVKHVDCDKNEIIFCLYSYTIWKVDLFSFMAWRMVCGGVPFYLKFWAKLTLSFKKWQFPIQGSKRQNGLFASKSPLSQRKSATKFLYVKTVSNKVVRPI